MDRATQGHAAEAHDARSYGIVGEAAEGEVVRPEQLEGVEFGSGWYHDAAIRDSEQAAAGRH